jgi:hypothetical protein
MVVNAVTRSKSRCADFLRHGGLDYSLRGVPPEGGVCKARELPLQGARCSGRVSL